MSLRSVYFIVCKLHHLDLKKKGKEKKKPSGTINKRTIHNMGIEVEKVNDSEDRSKTWFCKSGGFVYLFSASWLKTNQLSADNQKIFDNRSLCIFYHKTQRISKDLTDIRLPAPISTYLCSNISRHFYKNKK